MKFLAITLIAHLPDPLTGVVTPTAERFRDVAGNAVMGEELGFDGFGVGERHEQPFISSSPPVVLSNIAARTGPAPPGSSRPNPRRTRSPAFRPICDARLARVRALGLQPVFMSDVAPVLRREIPSRPFLIPPVPPEPAVPPAPSVPVPPVQGKDFAHA